MYNKRVYEYEPYIVEKLAYDVILGIDFAIDHQMKMTCGEAINIEFQGKKKDCLAVNAISKGHEEEIIRGIIDEFHK